jgi:lipopolysaccharide transport system ATP-binding protein
MHYAVVVESLGKQFYRSHPDRPRTLHEALVKGLRGLQHSEGFWALQDVSFNVKPGRALGIIGSNGSGKSTLLRLIGGVGKADKGSVVVNGRIGALLDFGAGFNPDLTGRENVIVGGVIAGLTRREVSKRFDSIVAFAEIEPFIDNPLRTYSSGMQMRLGFAVAVHVEAQVLLIDEVLSVGDHAFQHKCLDRIGRFKADGCTIILVSHDTELVREFCDEALWLNSGRLVARGRPEMVVDRYIAAADATIDQRATVNAI